MNTQGAGRDDCSDRLSASKPPRLKPKKRGEAPTEPGNCPDECPDERPNARQDDRSDRPNVIRAITRICGPLLMYGSSSVTNTNLDLSLYRMSCNEAFQYAGILSLLLHFHWIWIGVLFMDNAIGERNVQSYLPEFSKHGICIAFTKYRPNLKDGPDFFVEGQKLYEQIMGSTANVFVVFGVSYSVNELMWLPYLSDGDSVSWKAKGKLWILTAQMEFASYGFQTPWEADEIHGILAFTDHSSSLPGFQKFVERRNPYNTEGDGFIQKFWHDVFYCIFPSQVEGQEEREEAELCTGQEKLESLSGSLFEMRMTGHSYSIYNAVYAVAHAIHAMLSFKIRHRRLINGENFNIPGQDKWQTDVDASAHDGSTPLILATRLGVGNVVEELVANHVDVGATDKRGESAVHWAAAVNHVRAAVVLLQNGANKDAQDQRVQAPLFLAAQEGSYKVVCLLLQHGAQKNVPDRVGRLARDVAQERLHHEIVALLDPPHPSPLTGQPPSRRPRPHPNHSAADSRKLSRQAGKCQLPPVPENEIPLKRLPPATLPTSISEAVLSSPE
uniref:Uncharacterized protein n=1 Tax=Sphaerodactylus townsendi TaxID=933632 RepID=A0ACB8EUT8_9SAUR